MFNAAKKPVSAGRRLLVGPMRPIQALFSRRSKSSLARDERGNVAIIFALTSFVVCGMVGGAIDLGRAYSAKSKIQQALDSAALAAASSYASDPNHVVQSAVDVGTRIFTATMADETGATISSQLEPSTQTVTMQAEMTIQTPFLSMLRLDSIVVTASSQVTTAEMLGGSNTEVEMALMLDVTGSMGSDSGNGTSKISALRTAAKNFVDILIPETGTAKAKIGLAPFSNYVTLTDAQATFATGEPLIKTTTTTSEYQCNPHQSCAPATCNKYKKDGVTCRDWNDPVCTTVYDTCTSTSSSTKYLSRCMIERTGTEKFKDTAPGTGAYFTATWKNSESSAKSCVPTQTVEPMTTNKTTLKSKIDTFVANGSTAGHLGTAWAWYLLSPEWSGLFSGTAAPKPYGTEKLKKIAVLMTDGEFNLDYTSTQGDSVAQAKALCDGMKAKGIEVFTVGFKLDNATAISTMNYCATDASHAFLAESASQLEAAFKEIAFQAVPLHIAK